MIQYNFNYFIRLSADKNTHGRGDKRVQGFGGKAQNKRPLGRPRRRWEDGIRMDLTEIG
jgi:hypothetical protein